MARLMDACAEHGKKMIILDRPNPNGMYVDGPILDMKHKSMAFAENRVDFASAVPTCLVRQPGLMPG